MAWGRYYQKNWVSVCFPASKTIALKLLLLEEKYPLKDQSTKKHNLFETAKLAKMDTLFLNKRVKNPYHLRPNTLI